MQLGEHKQSRRMKEILNARVLDPEDHVAEMIMKAVVQDLYQIESFAVACKQGLV